MHPYSITNPVYSGTKSWLRFWSMNLRTQPKDSNIKVVEIVPPTVATDLHREREDPDDNKKEDNMISLSIEEFMDFVSKGWKDNLDTIGAGLAVKFVDDWYKTFGDFYSGYAEAYGKKEI